MMRSIKLKLGASGRTVVANSSISLLASVYRTSLQRAMQGSNAGTIISTGSALTSHNVYEHSRPEDYKEVQAAQKRKADEDVRTEKYQKMSDADMTSLTTSLATISLKMILMTVMWT